MRRAAIVSPLRTGVGGYGGTLRPLGAEKLGGLIIKALMERTGIDPGRIEDVVFAQGYPSGEAPAIGRWAALDAGLPIEVPGMQLDRRCGGGLQAVLSAAIAKIQQRQTLLQSAANRDDPRRAGSAATFARHQPGWRQTRARCRLHLSA